MKKEKNRKRLLDDRRIVLLLAFVLAFLSWVVVAGFIKPGDTRTISNVPIDYQRNAENTYKRYDLQIVTNLTSVTYADLKVQGDAALISRFNNTDVAVYPNYSAVTGPGTYEIPLRAEKTTSGGYNIVELTLKNGQHSFRNNPTTTVSLTFEEVQEKTFRVVTQSENVTAATGYFKDEPIVSQPEVTVSGPASEVAKVAQVAALVTDDEDRTETKIYTVPLTLLDADGKTVESSQLTISPTDTVEVTIPILEIRDVGLDVGLIGVPQGFDMEWFKSLLSLSTESIEVIGTSQAFSNLSNPYNIAEIDLSEMGLGWESDPITVELPEGLRTQTPAQQVVVRFNSTGLAEKSFRVSNMRVVNSPTNATITPIVNSLTVTLIGPQEQLEELLPENIMIEVDAFDLLSAKSGQQTLPARVLVPSKNQVFATGQYSVVCDIGVQQ